MDFDISATAPEQKAGVVTPHDELMRAFEAFRDANDERLAALERRSADVLLEEKVDRINAALDGAQRRLDAMALKQARPALEGASAAPDLAAAEHKSAFDAYVRSGEAGELRRIETKAMSAASNPDGGYLVPVELEREIGRRLAAISPLRARRANCAASRPRRCRRLPTPTAAIWCRSNWNARSAGASPRSRRCGRWRRCARFPPPSTRSRS